MYNINRLAFKDVQIQKTWSEKKCPEPFREIVLKMIVFIFYSNVLKYTFYTTRLNTMNNDLTLATTAYMVM